MGAVVNAEKFPVDWLKLPDLMLAGSFRPLSMTAPVVST